MDLTMHRADHAVAFVSATTWQSPSLQELMTQAARYERISNKIMKPFHWRESHA
jgi:hypothetical protein